MHPGASHVVPYKGRGVSCFSDQLKKDLRKFGIYGKVILKPDQENAIIDVLRDLAKSRAKDGLHETIIESSPKRRAPVKRDSRESSAGHREWSSDP